MQSIESLYEHITRIYPRATATLTPPLNPDGFWSLDVDLDEKHLAIQWARDTGFGISSVASETLAEYADEVIGTAEEARRRVDQLLTSSERTVPPRSVLLSRLREHRGLTQRELAEKLGVRQATVSGFERRGDIQLTTLYRLVEALGGVLEVWARFPEATYRIDSHWMGDEPRSCSLEVMTGTVGGPAREGSFDNLRKAGELGRALAAANTIKISHAVIEMP
jgi:transcriptional regulator with XRE-family HTH domain